MKGGWVERLGTWLNDCVPFIWGVGAIFLALAVLFAIPAFWFGTLTHAQVARLIGVAILAIFTLHYMEGSN